MEQVRITRQENYDKASSLLGEIFDASSDIVEQINYCMRNNGIRAFFENLDDYDFHGEVLEKLRALKILLFELSEEAIISEGGAVLEERTK